MSLLLVSLVPLLFLALPFLFQMPDPNSLELYGVPLALVGVVIVGLFRRYVSQDQEKAVLVSAVWVVISYFLAVNLPDVKIDWFPKYVPQILWAVILFGAQLGLVPGQMANRTYNRVKLAFKR